MARLPQVGGDSGSWGEVLNEYLSVSHNADGTLKSGAVSGGAVQDGSVTIDKLAQENAPMSGQVLSYSGTGLNWTSVSVGGAVPDANATTKGLVQLAGDLSGTAAAPTVPGLAGKEDTVVVGTTAQYYRGDKSWQALNQAAVGLGNVDNTSDATKPISSATQTALDGKAATSHVHAAADITSGTIATARLPIASDTASGVVELATSAEAITGADTTRAVTPAGLKASVDAALSASPSQILFVDAIADVPPGTPVDTLIVVRAA